jgi:hypothetical protein
MFPLGRLALLMFEFEFEFMLKAVAIGVAIGVGVEMFVLRLALLLLTVLFAEPPQPTPKAPTANTAVSAIFFITNLFSCLLQRKLLLTVSAHRRWFAPKRNEIIWNKANYKNPPVAKSTEKTYLPMIICSYGNLEYQTARYRRPGLNH